MSLVKKLPRFMIVGTGSGSGKTTITCAILRAIQNTGLKISGFKCGPDYIDPMFHTKVLGTKSKNLDLFMCGERVVKYLFAENSKNSQLSIIEGVMGMYDGINFEDRYSSNHLALVTNTPEILVVNGRGKSLSLVSEIYGFLNFKKNNIKGIIINEISKGMYEVLKDIIETNLKIKVYGYFPTKKDVNFKSRHLGLVTAEEIEDIENKINILAKTCKETIDLKGLIQLSNENSDFYYDDIDIQSYCSNKKIRIGVAYDKAFSFYYEDNFLLLNKLGAELVFFSPLEDTEVPENISGLIFGGGYPEEYGKLLSENKSMVKSVHNKIHNGIPTIAECGGYMYLCKSLTDNSGIKHDMVNIFNIETKMSEKLSRFGYVEITAKNDNLLCKKGEKIKAHEFHYSDSDNNGNCFLAKKENGMEWNCIHGTENIFAGYPHIHFWGNIKFTSNFIKKCGGYNYGLKHNY